MLKRTYLNRSVGLALVALMISTPVVAQTAIQPVNDLAQDILATAKVILPIIAFCGICFGVLRWYRGRIEAGTLWAILAATLIIGAAPWIIDWIFNIGGGISGFTGTSP